MNNIVEVKNLDVIFGDFYAVKKVSFSVKKGEIFGFLGANGAGKTTTIRVLCGLLLASGGQVLIGGEKLVKGKENLIKKQVGYMSQKFTLYDDLSVEENLMFTASLRQIPEKLYEERKKVLFDFIGFEKDTSVLISELSGGVKQEIALVASMLHDPQIIFLDEPTAGVAPVSRARFWELINDLARKGKTVFVTTHYMDEAENCSRVALMRSGELIALDSPENLKKTAYKEQIYKITLKKPDYRQTLLNQDKKYFAMLSPYGQHYHGIIAENYSDKEVISIISKNCEIKKIPPSLEDVFIRLVEGDR